MTDQKYGGVGSPSLSLTGSLPLGASLHAGGAAGGGAATAAHNNFFSTAQLSDFDGGAAASALASATAREAASAALAASPKSVRDFLLKRVGFLPRDAFGWLYACRGLYQLREYTLVIEGLSHCLRNEKTMKEAQHLLAFSLLHTRQPKLAAAAFYRSIQCGNHTDWQPLVELFLDNKNLTPHILTTTTGAAAGGAAAAAAPAATSAAAATTAGGKKKL